MIKTKLLLLVVLISFSISFASWLFLDFIEEKEIKNTVKAQAAIISNEIKSDFSNRLSAMLRMAQRWEDNYQGTNQQSWERDANNYVRNDVGYQAIEWVDSHGHVKWVIPLEGNEAAVNLNLKLEKTRKASLELSQKYDKPVLTNPIKLVQGGNGTLLFIPLFIGDVFDGYMLAVFNIDKWLQPLLTNRATDYALKLDYSNERVLSLGAETFEHSEFIEQFSFKLLEKELVLTIAPHSATLKQQVSFIDEFIAIAIFVILILLSMVFIFGMEKEAGRKLLASQELLLELKSAMDEHSLVSTTDLSGRITYVNDKFCQVSGYEKNELLGSNHRLLNSGHQAKDYWKNMYRVVAKGNAWHDEILNITKGGNDYWVDTTIVPNYDDAKKLSGYTSIRTDISERKSIESTLIQSETRFKTLYDNSPDMYVSIDPKSGLIILCNQTLLLKAGFIKEEIINKPVFNIFHESCAKLVRESIALFKKNGSLRNVELILLTKNGEQIDISLNSDAVKDDEGNILYSLSSLRDISEQKKTQAQLLQSEKLASLGQMVAGIAHEINTPLGTAITNVSELEIRAKKFKNKLELGITKTDMSNLLQDVADFSKMSSDNLLRAAELVRSFKLVAVDQSSEEKREFSLKNLIETVLITTQHEFKRTDIDIKIDCDEDVIMNSYPGALIQIITNLMQNSLIHGFDEGRKAGHINLKIQKTVTKVILQYSDTGKGLSKEQQEKMFEPFYTTRRNKGGSGLGTHIVHNLVTELLKGSISIESTLGKGVLFQMTFDLNEDVVAKD